MAFVEINPVYRTLLERHGLTAAEHFLALEGVIVSGHPDRHVARVSLGSGRAAVSAFLKREHRVRWKDRLANAWAGFGFVSKSRREVVMLREARRAGIGCPEWVATGEDRQGRAFLAVREIEGAVELRAFLRGQQDATARQRLRFARGLARALARLHEAGFDHPDLYSKHVLVHGAGQAVAFLDWQRCRRRHRLGWRRRTRCLAGLDASLADDRADTTERLACLRAYWRASGPAKGNGWLQTAGGFGASLFGWLKRGREKKVFESILRRIRSQARRLLRRPRIRELRNAHLATGVQNLIWLDGEALCVTREFRDDMRGRLPDWLVAAGPADGPAGDLTETPVRLPGSRRGTLVRRRARRRWWGLWCLLRRRPLTTPEFQQAATLFRLQRHGIGAPRLLAVGQRATGLGQTASFLLTERPADGTSLTAWLETHPAHPPAAARQADRRHVLRAAADLLRQMHEANHYLVRGQGDTSWPVLVQCRDQEPPRVVLSGVTRVSRRARPSPALAQRDLTRAGALLSHAGCSRGERLRFFLRYHRRARLTPAIKKFLRSPAAALGR